MKFNVGDMVEICIPEGMTLEEASLITSLETETVEKYLGTICEITNLRGLATNTGYYAYYLDIPLCVFWAEPLLKLAEKPKKTYNMPLEELYKGV